MSSPVETVIRPRYCSVPEYDKTLGPQVCDLSAAAGFVPDPEQRLIHDVLFARDKRNRSVVSQLTVIAGRQNIKSSTMRQAALAWLFLFEEPLVVWSAQRFETVKFAWRDMNALIEQNDWLSKRVAQSYKFEAFELKSGAVLTFKTRTPDGGRGLSGNKVILDEAYALTDEQMAALVPAMSAMPDPQVMLGSSAPMLSARVLRRIRDQGRAGSNPRAAYFDWCAPLPGEACDAGWDCSHEPGTPGCGFDKPDMLRMGNPQYGKRIGADTVADERAGLLSVAKFARERMGWGDDELSGSSDVFAPGAWDKAATHDEPPKPMALGVAADLDQTVLSLAAASDQYVGSILRARNGSGTASFVEEVKRISTEHEIPVAIDRKGPASTLIPTLEDEGVQVETGGLDELVAACADFRMLVDDGTLRHGDTDDLNEAVAVVGWRTIGDRRAFGRKGGDISMLEAATWALWAARDSQTVHIW